MTKNERQSTNWEKIFINDIFNKGLIFKTYEELTEFNTKKQKQPTTGGHEATEQFVAAQHGHQMWGNTFPKGN